MINLHDYLAILIDADNVPLSYTPQVLKLAEYYGQLEICRAYGDWKQARLTSSYEKLDNKVEYIQVDQIGKNATDHRLLVEAGEIVADSNSAPGNRVSIVILVSGDGDFASACRFLQDRGAQVIVIGRKNKISLSLQETCDKFYFLEALNDELEKLRELHSIPPNEVREFYHPLRMAYHQLTGDKYDWVSYSQIDAILQERYPDFKRKFGKHELSDFIKEYHQNFQVDGQMVRRIDANPEQERTRMLLNAYVQSKQPVGIVSLTLLGQTLHKLDPNYEYHFGSTKLSKWLANYQGKFEIRDGCVIHKNKQLAAWKSGTFSWMFEEMFILSLHELES